MHRKLYNTALEYALKSLKLKEEIDDRYGMANTLNNIGNIYEEMGEFGKAENFLQRGLRMAIETGTKEFMMDSYQWLSSVNQKSKNYKKSLEYYHIYSSVRDSLFNENQSEQMAEMNTRFETEKKEKTIEILNQKAEIQNLDLYWQRIWKYSLGAGLLLIAALAFLLFNRNRIKQRYNQLLTKRNEIIIQQKKVIEDKNKDFTDSIEYAKGIQQAILPLEEIQKRILPEHFILFKPRDIVSGDFYWIMEKNGLVFLAAADCTGHGVPGAFVSMVCVTALNRCMNEFNLTSPGDILTKTSELVEQTLRGRRDGMDISLLSLEFGVSSSETNKAKFLRTPNSQLPTKIQWSGANNSLLYFQDNKLKKILAQRQPIGKFENRKPFINHEIQLRKGDSIYIFTDGYADQFGGPNLACRQAGGKKFKYKQLEELLLSIQYKPMSGQREILNNTIENWKGNLEQVDDICVIGIRV